MVNVNDLHRPTSIVGMGMPDHIIMVIQESTFAPETFLFEAEEWGVPIFAGTDVEEIPSQYIISGKEDWAIMAINDYQQTD
jgi:hypothetical protein